MEVDVPPASVVSSIMEDDVNIPNRFGGDPWIQEISLPEFYRPIPQWNAEVFKQSAGEIVDDSHMRAAIDKSIDKVRPYERRAPVTRTLFLVQFILFRLFC